MRSMIDQERYVTYVAASERKIIFDFFRTGESGEAIY